MCGCAGAVRGEVAVNIEPETIRKAAEEVSHLLPGGIYANKILVV